MKFALKTVFTLASVTWFLFASMAACVLAVESNHAEGSLWFTWIVFAFGPILVVGLIGSMLGRLFQGRPTPSDHMDGLRTRRTFS
jgi:hypothetical protein